MATLAVFCVTDFWFPKIGGMERSIENLCCCLGPEFRVEVLTGGEPCGGAAEFPFPVTRLPIEEKSGYYGAALERIAAVAGRRIVHVFGFSYFWPQAQAEFVERVARMPRTAVVMKTPTLGDARRSLASVGASFVESVRCFIALTDAMACELRTCGIADHCIRSLPNGVLTDRYHPATAEEKHAERVRLGVPPDRPVFGFCGRFEKRKRLDVLASAARQCASPQPPCLLLMGATDDTFAAGVEVRPLLGDRVRWIPEHPDVRPFYRTLDAYVTASQSEGMSNAVLEALACGLPIVASDIPGHRELVRPGETGRLFPVGDSAALGAAIAEVACRRAAGSLAAWGLRSRKLACAKFNQREVARKYADLYRELAG